MTTRTALREPTSGYGLADAARMEWTKLRSLRSTWWVLAATVVGTVGIGVSVGVNTHDASGDLTNNALAGIVPGLLLTGALGVLTMTSEYSAGTVRATFAVVPRRRVVLLAKSAVFGIASLLVGEAAAFLAFLASGVTLPDGVDAPTLAQPDSLRAVLMTGAGLSLIGLLGLGLGAIIRHSAAAVGALVAGVYVLAQVIGFIAHSAAAYMPILIVANSLSTTKPVTCGSDSSSCPHFLSAWDGLGMLCGYAVVSLVVGGWLMSRRDA